jgi:hypothetical protein
MHYSETIEMKFPAAEESAGGMQGILQAFDGQVTPY